MRPGILSIEETVLGWNVFESRSPKERWTTRPSLVIRLRMEKFADQKVWEAEPQAPRPLTRQRWNSPRLIQMHFGVTAGKAGGGDDGFGGGTSST